MAGPIGAIIVEAIRENQPSCRNGRLAPAECPLGNDNFETAPTHTYVSNFVNMSVVHTTIHKPRTLQRGATGCTEGFIDRNTIEIQVHEETCEGHRAQVTCRVGGTNFVVARSLSSIPL